MEHEISRRNLLRTGVFGLAAGGAAVLTLRADALPTKETADVHDYQAFLDQQGVPRVAPAGKWEPSYQDILGPYHLAGAPFRGKVTPPLEPGKLLVIRGRVWGFDTKKPLANALLDVWQADAKGSYDLDDPAHPPKKADFKNRIRLLADETGYYEYETVFPGAYKVGAGPESFRPAHIHYMIQANGYRKLVTQLYFKGDPYIKRDRTASKSNLVIETEKIQTEHGTYDLGTFDIVLAQA